MRAVTGIGRRVPRVGKNHRQDVAGPPRPFRRPRVAADRRSPALIEGAELLVLQTSVAIARYGFL